MDVGTAGRILKTVVNFLEGLDHESLCEDCLEEKSSLFRRVEKFLKMYESETEIKTDFSAGVSEIPQIRAAAAHNLCGNHGQLHFQRT